ncbi:MAG: hypothetical protein ICV62_05450 [Cyanobacteria bacterium Co-bin13]|nr:hypothetical protein [Cyanobacteria bacterium Co-bin13]
MPSMTIRPGSQIRLKGQSEYVPDFLVVRCEGDQCWVRQHTWNCDAQLQIRVTQIAIPDVDPAILAQSGGKIVSLSEYRMRRKG